MSEKEGDMEMISLGDIGTTSLDGIDGNFDSASSSSSEEPAQNYRSYRFRWAMLAILSFLNICNAITWYTFAPIATITAAYYDVTLTAVNWLSLSYMVLFLFLYVPAALSLDKYGLRFSLIIGAIANFIGAWVRVLSIAFGDNTTGGSFAFLFIGQAITGIAQPFLLVAPTKLAGLWFDEKQRAIANAIMSASNPLGIALGSVISPLIVSDEHPENIDTVLWVIAIPCTIASACVFFVKDKPPSPPSHSAELKATPFFKGLETIVKSYAYWMLLLAFGIGLGVFNAFTTLLEQIIRVEGYDSDDAGIFGLLIIACGLIGAGVSGGVVDKTKRYKETMRVAFFFASLSFLWFTLALNPNRFGLIAASCCMLGFCSFAILPVCLEMSVETTFPVAEGTSAGGLWMAGQLFGIIFILLMDGPLTINNDMKPGLYFVIGMVTVATICAFLWRGPYKRLEYDQTSKVLQNSNNNDRDSDVISNDNHSDTSNCGEKQLVGDAYL